jgi:hypothetical protein
MHGAKLQEGEGFKFYRSVKYKTLSYMVPGRRGVLDMGVSESTKDSGAKVLGDLRGRTEGVLSSHVFRQWGYPTCDKEPRGFF